MKNREMMAFAPGRVNIIGEHIDYNGGLVLPMAINRGTYAKVKFNETSIINVSSVNFDLDGVLSFDYKSAITTNGDWLDYVKGVFVTLEKHGYSNQFGMDIEIFGNIPYGSGLSSSASLEVLIAQILNEANKFDISGEELAIFCKEAENEFIGVNSGIMDQFIIANGDKNCVMKLDCATLEYENYEIALGKYSILIANSNKKRALVDSKYNERKNECEQALTIAQKYYDIDNLCELLSDQLLSIESDFDETIYKRAKHVVTENERVGEMIEKLASKKFEEAFEILNEAQQSISNDYEVSCEELDFICEKSLELGASAARMTGAGFGGCCIIILESSKIMEISDKLTKLYNAKFNLDLEIYNAISDKKARVFWRNI